MTMALYLVAIASMLGPSEVRKAAWIGRVVSGTVTAQVWVGSPGRLKLMLPVQYCGVDPVGVAETSEESGPLPPAFKACTR